MRCAPVKTTSLPVDHMRHARFINSCNVLIKSTLAWLLRTQNKEPVFQDKQSCFMQMNSVLDNRSPIQDCFVAFVNMCLFWYVLVVSVVCVVCAYVQIVDILTSTSEERDRVLRCSKNTPMSHSVTS